MKRILLLSGAAAAALLGAGCGSVSLSEAGDSNRTLSGIVDFLPAGGAAAASAGGLPRDASMRVRVIDEHPESAASEVNGGVSNGLYNGQNAAPGRAESLGPQILGEATVADASAAAQQAPGSWQIPFKVPYVATDDQLRRGLNIEVRISYGGTVRYSNYNQYALTLGDEKDSHEIWVQRMR